MLETILFLSGSNRWPIMFVVHGKPTIDKVAIAIRLHRLGRRVFNGSPPWNRRPRFVRSYEVNGFDGSTEPLKRWGISASKG